MAQINVNYIQKVLECRFDKPIKILECVFRRLTVDDGQLSNSDIFRTQVTYEVIRHGRSVRNDRTLIVKHVIIDVRAPLGTNELVMFRHVLPNMKRILSIRDTADDNNIIKLFADSIFCERGENEVYVLEDLKMFGYERIDNSKGLDLAQSRGVMWKLAEFHAASMLYLNRYQNAVATQLTSPIVNGFSPTSQQGLTVFDDMRSAIEMVEQWTGFGGIVASMRICMENFNERITAMLHKRRSHFKVITHGKLWAQNILMRLCLDNDINNEPRDAAFVDFQLSFIGSCAYDINVFYNTSVQLEVLKFHRCALLRYYHERLTETLSNIHCPATQIPSWEAVVSEVYDLELIGYYALLCLLPKCCVDMNDSNQEYENQPRPMHENERVQEMFRFCLPRFVDLGVFNCF